MTEGGWQNRVRSPRSKPRGSRHEPFVGCLRAIRGPFALCLGWFGDFGWARADGASSGGRKDTNFRCTQSFACRSRG